MYIKNISLVFAFITYSLLVLSSPIKNDNEINAGDAALVSQSDNLKEEVSLSVDEISDDETLINEEDISEYIVDSDDDNKKIVDTIIPTAEFTALTDSFTVTEFRGDYGLDDLLEYGADNDTQVIYYALSMIPRMIQTSMNVDISAMDDDASNTDEYNVNVVEAVHLGCTTISVPKKDGKGQLFGRNFDWSACNKTAIVTHPINGYSSVSTINTDLLMEAIQQELPDIALKAACIYAPLDGMNEMGVGISINEILVDGDNIHQNEENKKSITTTTAVRMILDKADSVEKAIELLESYNLQASFEIPVHFSISDNTGRAVVVEYVNNKMNVIESQINENFYLTPGQKDGLSQKIRYGIIKNRLEENPTMTFEQVRDTLQSVGQRVIGEFSSTEWSIVFDQESKEVTYYDRENFNHGFRIEL